jgi:hypothetical protein
VYKGSAAPIALTAEPLKASKWWNNEGLQSTSAVIPPEPLAFNWKFPNERALPHIVVFLLPLE